MLKDKLRESIDYLKDSGVRITPQRHAILEFLIDTKVHPSADEIYKALEGKFPNMSVATVYNNLRVFKSTGLVKELTYGDSSSRFDFATAEHYHVICDICGRIEDFDYPILNEIEQIAARETGYEISGHRLELYGKCPSCKNKDEV